jgi:hypothetical protein
VIDENEYSKECKINLGNTRDAHLTPRKKLRMSVYTRLGIALLIVGAIVVGLGTYYDRGAISLYGLFFVIAGFVLYFASSVITSKRIR